MSEYITGEYITVWESGLPDMFPGEEIVRCRDCVFYDDYLGSCIRGNAHQVFAAEPDGFCKWGARRSE